MNVQGDEPLVEPEAIDTLVEAIESEESVSIATLMVPIAKPGDIMDPNIVKVVLDFDDNALYFSRAPIPWVRDRESPVHVQHMKHLGLYAFRRAALLDFPTLPLGDLERIEQLEQLRWMENGYKIRVAETHHDSVSVDVPEDVARVEKLLSKTLLPSLVTGFRLWNLGLTRSNPHRLNRLRKNHFILSFRAKRGISLRFKYNKIKEGEIPRFARNDRAPSFSAACLACAT